jgi:hypothetical protein
MTPTESKLADALFYCCDFWGFGPDDIDPAGLRELAEDFAYFYGWAMTFADDEAPTVEALALQPRRCLVTDYLLSRIGAGTGLWDNYRYGGQLHKLAVSQGRLEGLHAGLNGTLHIS